MEIIIAIVAGALIIGIVYVSRRATYRKYLSDKAKLASILTETSGFYSVKHLSEIGRLGIR